MNFMWVVQKERSEGPQRVLSLSNWKDGVAVNGVG